mgnify:CR=1 FL=1
MKENKVKPKKCGNWPVYGARVNDMVMTTRQHRPVGPYSTTYDGVGVVVDVIEATKVIVLWSSGVTAMARTAWLERVTP